MFYVDYLPAIISETSIKVDAFNDLKIGNICLIYTSVCCPTNSYQSCCRCSPLQPTSRQQWRSKCSRGSVRWRPVTSCWASSSWSASHLSPGASPRSKSPLTSMQMELCMCTLKVCMSYCHCVYVRSSFFLSSSSQFCQFVGFQKNRNWLARTSDSLFRVVS